MSMDLNSELQDAPLARLRTTYERFKTMYERFKTEINGIELRLMRGKTTLYKLTFADSGNSIAYRRYRVIAGYGNMKSDVSYDTELLSISGDPAIAFGDFLSETSKSKHVYVIDQSENLVVDCDFDYGNSDEFWKCVRRLGMKLRLIGIS